MATALIIDDERNILGLLDEILRREGFDVLLASSGADAFQHEQCRGGEIAIALCDVNLQDSNGIAVAKVIRQRRPHIQILLMSGIAADLSVNETAEFTHYIHKPFTPTELIRKIKEVLLAA